MAASVSAANLFLDVSEAKIRLEWVITKRVSYRKAGAPLLPINEKKNILETALLRTNQHRWFMHNASTLP
jgi:hypothetical protein